MIESVQGFHCIWMGVDDSVAITVSLSGTSFVYSFAAFFWILLFGMKYCTFFSNLVVGIWNLLDVYDVRAFVIA
jgi:hypothetical protein